MHTFQVDDKQQGVDHVRKQDEHRGNSSVCAGDTCMLNIAHKTQPVGIHSVHISAHVRINIQTKIFASTMSGWTIMLVVFIH